jgi:hypothetical protein
MDGGVETGTCRAVASADLTGRLSERIALGQEHAPPIHSSPTHRSPTHLLTHSLTHPPTHHDGSSMPASQPPPQPARYRYSLSCSHRPAWFPTTRIAAASWPLQPSSSPVSAHHSLSWWLNCSLHAARTLPPPASAPTDASVSVSTRSAPPTPISSSCSPCICHPASSIQHPASSLQLPASMHLYLHPPAPLPPPLARPPGFTSRLLEGYRFVCLLPHLPQRVRQTLLHSLQPCPRTPTTSITRVRPLYTLPLDWLTPATAGVSCRETLLPAAAP